MNDAVSKSPSIAEQISSFKGVATDNSTVTSVQDGEPVGSEGDDSLSSPDVGGQVEEPPLPAPKSKPKSAQERIDLAVKRQRQAERERDEFAGRLQAYDERLARIEGRQNTPLTNGVARPTKDPNAPDPTKYQYGDLDASYITDLAKYEVRKELATENEKRVQATRAVAATEQQKQAQEFVKKGSDKYPDFQEAVFESARREEWKLSTELGLLAIDSEVGHEILYYLASNPEESERVAALSPAKQAAWFGRMEATVDKVTAKTIAANGARGSQGSGSAVRTSQAPPPPQNRIRGGGSPNPVSSDTSDFAAFERLANNKAH